MELLATALTTQNRITIITGLGKDQNSEFRCFPSNGFNFRFTIKPNLQSNWEL